MIRTVRGFTRGSAVLLASLFGMLYGASFTAAAEEFRPEILLRDGQTIPKDVDDPEIWQAWIDREAAKRGKPLEGDWRHIAKKFKEQNKDVGIYWPLALVQAVHETGFFQFKGDQRRSSNNVGGIGVSLKEAAAAKKAGRAPGDTYDDLDHGVKAFMQYVATYGGKEFPPDQIESDYLKSWFDKSKGITVQDHILAKSQGFRDKYRPPTFFDLGKPHNVNNKTGFKSGALGYAGRADYGQMLMKHWINGKKYVEQAYVDEQIQLAESDPANDQEASAKNAKPDLNKVWGSDWGSIHFGQGWYGSKEKTINVTSLTSKVSDSGTLWICTGTWGRRSSDYSGGFVFTFTSANSFSGVWWDATSPKTKGGWSGSTS